MDNHELSRSVYSSMLRSLEPLCPGCLDMNPSVFDWRAVTWATTYPDLDPRKVVLGADSGCTSCTLIYAAFQSVGLDLRTSHAVQIIGFFNSNEGGSLIAKAEFDQNSNTSVELYTIRGDTCPPWSIINQKTHLSGYTASKASFQDMEKWIKKCEADHEKCSYHSGAPLPTRVIDLGHSNDVISLLETRDVSGPYICLSHCWGESSTVLCTRETYEGFTDNIPWNSLPPLFRDAIEVCRTLKIRYLWIDKLCIIQHDKEDWAREGSRMAQIFEGSFLTIAALASKNDRDPLFFEDKRYAPSQKSHTGLMKDGTMYTVYSRIPVDYHPGHQSRPGIVDEHYPLMTRAWVYQERLLAPRILYFGKELSWECRETSACECSGMTQGLKYEHSLSLTSAYSTSKLYLQWQDMVESYTWLRLSREDDRLPAISGLAQQFQRHFQSTYLAGLWKANVKADLLWSSFPASNPEVPRYYTRKPVKWRAPSWSWASIEGPIMYWRQMTDTMIKYEIQILAAECTPSSVDRLGAVYEGRLVIRGSSGPNLLSHREDCVETETRHFSVQSTGIRSFRPKDNFTVQGQDAFVDYDLIEQGLMEPNSDMSIHCLYMAGEPYTQRVYDRSWGKYDSYPAHRMFFLLLRHIDDKVFERIGVLMCEYMNGEEAHIWSSLREDTITIL